MYNKKLLIVPIVAASMVLATACGNSTTTTNSTNTTASESTNIAGRLNRSDVKTTQKLTNNSDGEHVIEVDNKSESYAICKTSS